MPPRPPSRPISQMLSSSSISSSPQSSGTGAVSDSQRLRLLLAPLGSAECRWRLLPLSFSDSSRPFNFDLRRRPETPRLGWRLLRLLLRWRRLPPWPGFLLMIALTMASLSGSIKRTAAKTASLASPCCRACRSTAGDVMWRSASALNIRSPSCVSSVSPSCRPKRAMPSSTSGPSWELRMRTSARATASALEKRGGEEGCDEWGTGRAEYCGMLCGKNL
mmetsp:Transcript_68810/g.149767  ORF Transcript_68810/g.149767 Transcript_68810/m.149767 type:complete len:220 (-) Transcript_68810:1069-1728(-)